MKIKINFNKKTAMIAFGIIFLLAGSLVYAYGTSSPSTFGHSAGEINLDGSFQTMTKRSSEGSGPTICCDSGWKRVGCGESGDSKSYSYPITGECCKGWFDGDGNVWVTCAKLD